MWIVSAELSVNAYSARDRNASKPVVPTIRAIRANTPIGKNLMIPEVNFIIVWNSASKRSTTMRCERSGRVVIAAPKTMQKKMRASMSAVAAAWITFSGTISSSNAKGEVGVSNAGRSAAVASVMFAPTPGLMRLTRKSQSQH